ncbi:MAG: hypothetical protein WCR29_02590 [Bacteroidales bacterium]
MNRSVLLLFILISLSISVALGQISRVNISEKTIGINKINNKDIITKDYSFIPKVENFYIDSIRNYAIIQLRNMEKDSITLKNDGYFLALDLSLDSVLWEKPFDYSIDNLYFYNNSLLHCTQNKINFISTKTGETSLSLDNSLYYIEKNKKIALAYKTNLPTSSNIVEAIDISSGKILWERDIDRENGWDNIHLINDSILAIYSDAFYLININNGKTIEFKAKTIDKRYGKTILTGTLSLTLAILTGSYDIDIEAPEEINYLQSDILADSSYYFYASKDKLYKLDKTGKIIWNQQFEKLKVSHSTLFKKDSILYMINNGYAFKDGEIIDYGIPFLAAFNAITGEPIYYNIFKEKTKKNERILDYKLEGREIILVFKESIGRYQLNNGSFLSERKVKNSEYGEIISFIKDDIYIKKSGNYIKILDIYPKNYNIYTSYGYVLSLNRDFTTREISSYNDIFFSSSTANKGDEILVSDSILTVISSSNRIILEIPYLNNPIIIRDKLFATKENSFFAIDFQ